MGLTASALKIGFYGGAFDPPHRVHVQLARVAISHLHLDALHIVPTGDAYHKARILASARLRVHMCRLAFAGLPGVCIDEQEIRRTGASYTVDSLRQLRQEYPHARLYLLMGADQAARFDRWHEALEIASLATLVVAARAGVDAQTAGTDARLCFAADIRAQLPHVRMLPMPARELSSSAIRDRLQQGLPVEQFVPAPVARYIEAQALYQSS